MSDYQVLSEEDNIIVESLMALSHGGATINGLHNHHHPHPHPHPHHDQQQMMIRLALVDHDDGCITSTVSTPTMKMRTSTSTVPRRKRSRQITLMGIREAHKDMIKEKACRANIALLLHHLPDFQPPSTSILSLGNIRKNNNNNNNKVMMKKKKKKAVEMNATKDFGRFHQPNPKFAINEVAPLKLKFRKVVQDQTCALASSLQTRDPFEFDLKFQPSVGF